MNSANQWWSKWTFTVVPGGVRRRVFAEVRENCARFGRKAFGSASQMRVTQLPGAWRVEVRTEGHPAHDAAYVAWMDAQWKRFFESGFGQDTQVSCAVKLEAGSRQDGTPAEQLLMLPRLSVRAIDLAGVPEGRHS